MATDAASGGTSTGTGLRSSAAYDRFAGGCAVVSALALLLSGLSILLGNGAASAGLLTLSGLLTMAALLWVYLHLRAVDDAFSLLGLVLGVIGAIGAVLHGGLDLDRMAVIARPPTG